MTSERHDQANEQLTRLRKVLKLEAQKGFQDTAVIGGIDRFIATFAARLPSDHATALSDLFADYARLLPKQRADRVSQAYRWIEGAGEQDGRATTPSPAPRVVSPSRTSAPARAAAPRRAAAPVSISSLDDPVTVLPGVGEARARQLDALGVRTVYDLLYLLPRYHKDYSKVQQIASLMFQGECTIRGEVTALEEERTRTGKRFVVATVADRTGSIRAIWFNPYVARQLPVGTQVALSGRVEQQRGNAVLRNPEWETLDAEMLHTGRLVPVYPLTRGLYQKQVRQLTRAALDAGLALVPDGLSDDIRQRHRLLPLARALESIHFPASQADEQAAANRLAFDEFLVLQLGLVQRKVAWQSETGHAFAPDPPLLDAFHQSLPFQLTEAQQAALDEILNDMAQPKPMSRLLQGDVGSGKTVVAASAALVAIADGSQAALLAPTEILAEQHFRSLDGLFTELPEADRPRVALLTGSSGAAERAEIDAGLQAGEIQLLVGTHAILEERVSFARLGLAIVDEQHRFGVAQRARLRDKGYNPDVLVMTATPIPRSLALVMHGDLDVSIIDQLPPGRQTIATSRVGGEERKRVYAFLRKQIAAGHQAFVIYPLVEESEAIDAKAATAEYERLSQEVFPDLRLGLLHGRLRPAEKEAVMHAFRDHEIDILVSTSVVEVGIDVPNATVMVIEGADRFGLSQLHQFRGRVGRGAARSYCILVGEDVSDEGARRLDALVETHDGFRLAQIDLELRGPGEFFGTRQSGLPDLKLASLGDLTTLQRARDEAHRILADDVRLSKPENQALRRQVDRFWATGAGDLS